MTRRSPAGSAGLLCAGYDGVQRLVWAPLYSGSPLSSTRAPTGSGPHCGTTALTFQARSRVAGSVRQRATCRDATRYKASGAMRSRGEAGKVLRGDEWQAGDHRLWQCRRGRSTWAAPHRREQTVPQAPPQASDFAKVKATTWLVAKSSRVGCCASAARGMSSPRSCFGRSGEENPSAAVLTADRKPTYSETPPGRTCGASHHTPLSHAYHRLHRLPRTRMP